MPHLDVDPIVAAAGAVRAVQALVSRETNPLESSVVSVTRFHAGDAYNVIPDEAEFGGTMRSLTHAGMDRLRSRFEEVVEHTARAHGCTATVDWMAETQPYYPPTVNDAALAGFVDGVARRMLGGARVERAVPSMGGEDFGFLAMAAPAAYTFLGIRDEAKGSVWPLHSPRFTLDEDVLATGAAMHTALALEWLAGGGGGGEGEL